MLYEQSSDRAIVTLCIGDQYNSMSTITCSRMRSYAERIGADFVVIDSSKLNLSSGHYEKFQLYELLNIYDRIAFLDLDVLVLPNCPDLFALVSPECFGAFDSSKYITQQTQIIDSIQDILGDVTWKHNYFNSGVMIVSQQHQEVFNPNNGLLNKCASMEPDLQSRFFFYDQTLINYNVKRLNIPFYDIGYKFNHTTASRNSYQRFNSFIIHYPGIGHRRGSKVQQISKDASIIESPLKLSLLAKLSFLNIVLDRF